MNSAGIGKVQLSASEAFLSKLHWVHHILKDQEQSISSNDRSTFCFTNNSKEISVSQIYYICKVGLNLKEKWSIITSANYNALHTRNELS